MCQDEEDLKTLLAITLDYYFKQLVVAYQYRLYSFMLRQTGSAQDAEDIVQEAFLQAYFALADYPLQRVRALNIQPWLYKIALNNFYSHVRKSKLRIVSLDEPVDGSQLELEDYTQQPDLLLEGRQSLPELEKLVIELPEHYRETVNLYYFEGLSYQEIADVLNIPMGTVKSNLHRGLQLLRKALTTQRKEVR